MNAPTLYVTYDGLGDPLGKSQVLPYVRGLAERGYPVHLLSFEKPGNPLAWNREIAKNVRWFALRYHQRPSVPATAFDIMQGLGANAAFELVRGVRLVHVRSYVPAIMALPWAVARGVPTLFDMRGLWVDERVEAGSWKTTDRAYRVAKDVERRLLSNATAITVLTNAMQTYLRHEYSHREAIRAPIRVIPTCADLELFHPATLPDAPTATALAGARTLVYVGSLGRRYLPDVMARFYLKWRRGPRPTRFLVVSLDAPDAIRQVLAEAGLDVETELVHRTASREEVPRMMRCASAGVFFYRQAMSTYGCAPTKLGEMLACGIPVAGNSVGDVTSVLKELDPQLLVTRTDDATLESVAARLRSLEDDGAAAGRARSVAERWFSLDHALDAYEEIYVDLLAGRPMMDRGWPSAHGSA